MSEYKSYALDNVVSVKSLLFTGHSNYYESHDLSIYITDNVHI